MANLSKVIYINERDYSTLVNGGTITKGGQTYSYDESALYVIKDVGIPEYAEEAGYAATAGTATAAVLDGSGNSIAATYEKKPLIIEVNESDDGSSLEQRTYDSITQALTLNKQVILKIIRDNHNDEIIYLPLVKDISASNQNYTFGAIEDQIRYFGSIDDHDYFEIYTEIVPNNSSVVHKSQTETITGNKTFSGTTTFANSVSLGSSATATTPAAGDNDTSVATTAFVQNAVNALPTPMLFKGSLGTGGTYTGSSLPSAANTNKGWTVKVITDGTYQGVAAKVGDTLISDGTNWILIPSGDEPSGTVTSIQILAESPISVDAEDAITSNGVRTITHDNSGITAGTYKSVTVDAKGHVTAGTNPTTLAGYGITDAINTSSTALTKAGNLTAAKFIKSDGTSTQFLKADGSVDSTTYAPLNSPAITGTPTAPTAAVGTNTTLLATTAFVLSAVSGKGYWANLLTASAANYITEPEVKSVKINGSSTNAASTENAVIQYDTTNKCIKFVFN